MSNWYQLEECYLTPKGKDLINSLIEKGMDCNLATEVARLMIGAEEMYDLGNDTDKERSDHGSAE